MYVIHWIAIIKTLFSRSHSCSTRQKHIITDIKWKIKAFIIIINKLKMALIQVSVCSLFYLISQFVLTSNVPSFSERTTYSCVNVLQTISSIYTAYTCSHIIYMYTCTCILTFSVVLLSQFPVPKKKRVR